MNSKNKILKKIKRAFCLLFALIFLFEAWLWDHLYPVVARLIAFLPWEEVKSWVRNRVKKLSPWLCVFIFIIPALIILPLKLLGVWLIGNHHAFLGIITFITAKLAGLGVASFIFESCKDKLLSLNWFLWLYNTLIALKNWSHKQIDPALRRIRMLKASIKKEKGGIINLLKKLRSNILHSEKR